MLRTVEHENSQATTALGKQENPPLKYIVLWEIVPRITHRLIRVRRVDSLEKSFEEIGEKQSTISFTLI